MAEIGETNSKQQKLLDKTEKPGNLKNAHLWIVRCMRTIKGEACDHIYGANGEDFFERKCPKCDGGAKGIPLP
jgi:hypothetical protein